MESFLPYNIFENLPAPYAVITSDSGKFIIGKVNKAFAGFVRKQVNEVEGQHVSFLSRLYSNKAGADLGVVIPDSLQSAFSTGRQQTSGCFADLENESPERRYWSIQNTPVHGDDGNISYVIHSIRIEAQPWGYDETGHENTLTQTAALLKSAEEKYEELFDCSPIPMWIYDMETYRVIDVNQAAVKHYGYSREEFLDLTIKDIRPEEDIPAVMQSVQYLMQSGKRYPRNNYRHLKKNGDMIQVRIESSIADIGGRKACIVLAIDITEDEQLRREIIAANNMLSAAQTMANLGHWVYSLSSGQVQWSEEMHRIFDTDPETFAPTPESIRGFFGTEDPTSFSAAAEQLFANGDSCSFKNSIITKQQNQKWLHHTRRLIRDEHQQPVLIEGICMDITQGKLDEAALQRKNSLLDAINKFTTILLGKGRPIDVINKAFTVIGETVNVDRVYFYESYAYEHGINLVNQRIEWNRERELPVIDNPDMQRLSLCVADLAAGLLPGGRFAAVVKELPDSSLKAFLVNQKALSVAALPIFVNDKFYGFIGFEHLREEHRWQEDEFAFLEAVTGHLATAIERYNAARALKNSREQFKSVINNLPGITYRCKDDHDWTMAFISEEVGRMTGYPATEFIDNAHRSFASIIHPDDLDNTYSISEQLKKREPFEIEYRIIRADGCAIWVKDIGRGVYSSSGRLLWIDGVILDVTDRIEQEQQLRTSNERFRLVMKASREAIMDWDIENDVTIWGDGFSGIFNYDLSVYDNHLWSRNIHPDDKERVLKAVEETIADPARDTLDLHFRFLKANRETAYVHHRGVFIRNAQGVAVRAIGSMSDVTEITLHTRKVEQQNAVLKEIAWMQSHGVRAPFARLMGLMGLLKDELPAETDTAGILAYMEESARELDRIITDIVIKSEQVNSKTYNEKTLQHTAG
jgi:PAS domain S-box-containing protein